MNKWLAITPGLMLLFAIPNGQPYDYFILLRWVVFVCAGILVWKFAEVNKNGPALTFGAIAFLFNPIFPIYLSKSSWVPIDLICAIIFFFSASFKTKKT